MKWVCLAVFIIDLLLFAFAGFQYFTVPRKDVDQMTVRIDDMVKRGRSGLTNGAFPSPGDADVDLYEEGVDDAPAGDSSESRPPARQADEGTEMVRPAYITDEAAAMNLNVLGVDRQAGKLKAIEDGRRLVNEEGAAALEEP